MTVWMWFVLIHTLEIALLVWPLAWISHRLISSTMGVAVPERRERDVA